jgi:hypothetical protein
MKSTPRSALTTQTLLFAALLATLSFSGCRHPAEPPPEARPQNVFQLTPYLPSVIRRVAVLPISTSTDGQEAAAGSAHLQPILAAELNRSGQFEVVEVGAEQMARWTGRRVWSPEEALPADFLEQMRTAVDADAVLFAHLSAYQPYKPMLMGWNLKLVDANAGYIIWAADQMYDAADPVVAKQAVRYGPAKESRWGRLGTDDSVLLSPKRFAHFTLEARRSGNGGCEGLCRRIARCPCRGISRR